MPLSLQVIPQLDGCDSSSFLESESSSLTDTSVFSYHSLPCEKSWFSQHEVSSPVEPPPQYIPVHTGFRPRKSNLHSRGSPSLNNITIKRDNRLIEALSLPVFSVYNMRSIWSKLESLAEDMDERGVDFAILSEVWEKKENPCHQARLEELFEMKNTKYFSTARPGIKRGGGAAIAARETKFTISKLNIDIPRPLEVVLGLLKPRTVHLSILQLDCCQN